MFIVKEAVIHLQMVQTILVMNYKRGALIKTIFLANSIIRVL